MSECGDAGAWGITRASISGLIKGREGEPEEMVIAVCVVVMLGDGDSRVCCGHAGRW